MSTPNPAPSQRRRHADGGIWHRLRHGVRGCTVLAACAGMVLTGLSASARCFRKSGEDQPGAALERGRRGSCDGRLHRP